MWPNLEFPADLVTFTEETLNGKLHVLCSDSKMRVEANGIITLAREYWAQYSCDIIPIIDVFITCKGYKNCQSVDNFHFLQKVYYFVRPSWNVRSYFWACYAFSSLIKCLVKQLKLKFDGYDEFYVPLV